MKSRVLDSVVDVSAMLVSRRLLGAVKPWCMVPVFLLGVLVSVVKLAKMAKIVPGVALYSFLALIFVLAAMTASLDTHLIWQKWENRR